MLRTFSFLLVPLAVDSLPGRFPEGFDNFLLNAFCVLGIAYFVTMFVQLFRRKPPIDAQFAAVTDSMSLKIADIYENAIKRIDEVDRRRSIAVANVHTKLDDEIGKMRGSINAMAVDLAAICAEAKGRTSQIIEIERKLDHMPERILAYINRPDAETRNRKH